jgi:hypothetical protein
MILSLALRFQKQIALLLLSISFVQVTIAERIGYRYDPPISGVHLPLYNNITEVSHESAPLKQFRETKVKSRGLSYSPSTAGGRGEASHNFIGGPTQPESQSFQSVNSNNMVDLFTGDFSYNIPLLDVGGYPVNIAYHSGVTMDEEASWVGLGWNINPGSITRNMRGVPDDFNGGTDTIKKTSSIKPNINWGATVGGDMEVLGLSKLGKIPGEYDTTLTLSVGASLGVFHTTYNGWGFEKSLNASINAGSKSFGSFSGGLSLTNNPQTGMQISPSVSYRYKYHTSADEGFGSGVQLAAPYNSRTGLKTIQMGLNMNAWNKGDDGKANETPGSLGNLTFSWPTYTPSISMPLTNYNFSVTLKLGTEAFGTHPNVFISGYYGREYVADEDKTISMPVFGYLNYQNVGNNWNALTDFNREKELPYREKPAIPHIAVPAYTYDVFSMSGEGTGGTFRAYRGDIGFIADHYSKSKTITGAASVDLGGGGGAHVGADLNANYAYTQTGPWQAENVIGTTIGFRNSDSLYEAAYFRNPAEKSINTTAFYDAIGGDDVVAPALSQSSSSSPVILASNTLNRYKNKTKVGSVDLNRASAVRNTRDKRSQVISYLTAEEASVVGLDKYIYHYAINKFGLRHCDDHSVTDTGGIGTGLTGYYYNNTALRGPYYYSRNDRNVFFNWDVYSPLWDPKDGTSTSDIDSKFPVNFFSARWLGRLKAPATGTFTFGINNDDGVRFWINDSLVKDRWNFQKVGGDSWTNDTVRVNLVKGHMYNIRMDYFENSGYAVNQWAWKRPDMLFRPFDRDHKDTVDMQYLYPPKFTDTTTVDSILVREDRVNGFRKKSHISEIDVLNPDGRRYVYGIPVYNLLQREVSFNVNRNVDNLADGLIGYDSVNNSKYNNAGKDGYYSMQEIPAYAHSFLLTGILSPDYVDVTGNGISDDDLGDAVRFNYSKSAGVASPFEWRAPYVTGKANYNEGLKSYNRDDKAHYIYGKKEVWYLNSIESKTMVANFTLQSRADLLEIDEQGIKKNNGKAFCLKQIDLYSKADFLAHGTQATPIKTVHFEYSYELCRGINNGGPNSNDSGKLTLKKIWFTYNGNDKGKQNPYIFHYHSNNPGYKTNAADKWGTYKDASQNPQGDSPDLLNNADYPYSLQDSSQAAYNAAAWTMDSIALPSGGRIKVNYESDDYAYVQNRRSAQMMQLVGFGDTTLGPNGDRLYSTVGVDLSTTDYRYAYVRIPVPVSSKQELFARYLNGISKLYFRLFVRMPDTDEFGTGSEYVPCYAEPDFAAGNWYGTTSDPNVIWIKIAGVNESGDGIGSLSPLAQAAINFLRLNLPSKAYENSETGDNLSAVEAVKMLVPSIPNLVYAIIGFNKKARLKNWVAHTTPSRSYVRLNCPTFKKYGGGLRVKSVLIYDHWNAMTKKKETVYGQQYDYTTIQTVNGQPTRISSGVASWEPTIGGEENPFHLPVEYVDRVSVLAPSSNQYSEEPLGEEFYPGASIGYSKVRIRTIHADKTRSANGYAETNFYTSYDFPTISDWSMFDVDTKKRFKPLLLNFLRINSRSYLSLSQGFKIELNDMNGKVRSEATYSETDNVHPISYTENFYRVDNQSVETKHLNNLVTTIDPYGNIDTAATIGKDVELMADMRDQTSVSIGGNINVNVDMWTAGAWPVVIPTLLNLFQKETNQFRSAAMTKVIYRYGILDSVVHIEKGSKISSKNMMYDAETGDPLLVRTQNEFNDPVYQFTYPAHWVYKGMGPAYQNIDAILKHLQISNGKITSTLTQPDSVYFTAGDELLVYSKLSISNSLIPGQPYGTFADSYKLWVIDSNAVRGGAHQFYLVDVNGVPFSGNDVTLKVIRSGRRNINGAVGSVASLRNPLIADAQGKYHLVFDTATHVISAGASEMQQYWKVADKHKMDIQSGCIATSRDSANFATQACSCVKPFFDYLMASGRLYSGTLFYRPTVGDIVNAANAAGYPINISACSILSNNLNNEFYSVSGPGDNIYEAHLGDEVITLKSISGANMNFQSLTSSTCTPQGLVYKNPNYVVPKPDTVTVRIVPDFSGSLLSANQCPTFTDSLTSVDSASDKLLVENSLNLGGYERNAITVLQFNNVKQVPFGANILSAQMILQADQRGHYGSMWPNANSVNPIDSMGVTLITPGWFPRAGLDAYHDETFNSDWYRQIAKATSFQNDTIDVKDYVEGYLNSQYLSTSFVLTQGSHELHAPDVNTTNQVAGYLQSGYGNYYSTYYSPRYADSTKWPVMQVTYVMQPTVADTAGALLEYNSTIECNTVQTRSCYSAITDTTVNPYQYGILGNFRPLRSYVYYSRRTESDPSQPVNTRTNGTINDFAPFWVLQNNTWMPSYDTTRWVWNSQTTLFNRKGFELENKDPLGRYNAGLYGYGETLPVAVLQNSHYQEGAYEGFEDYGFVSNNCDVACPETRPFDFSAYLAKFTIGQAHTGLYSLQVDADSMVSIGANLQAIAADADIPQLTTALDGSGNLKGMIASKNTILPGYAPLAGKKVIVGGWVREDNSCLCKAYTRNHIIVGFVAGGSTSTIELSPSGNLVEGWQRYEAVVDIPSNATQMTVTLQASDSAVTYFDDIRIHPYNAQMKSFVYNAVNLRLMAELDENNYATFYEYDDDGTLVRLKKETERGVQTIKETRSALLKE